jgi:hypothetical protein
MYNVLVQLTEIILFRYNITHQITNIVSFVHLCYDI